MGRPTKYKPEFDQQARKLCLLGFTDIELADFFEVSEQTIYTWKKEHPSFLEALTQGKVVADAEVAQAFYKASVGYYQTEQEAKVVGTGQGNSTVQIVEVKKWIQPDKGSQLSWLKNRQPKKWRDKQDHNFSEALTVTLSGPTPPEEPTQ